MKFEVLLEEIRFRIQNTTWEVSQINYQYESVTLQNEDSSTISVTNSDLTQLYRIDYTDSLQHTRNTINTDVDDVPDQVLSLAEY